MVDLQQPIYLDHNATTPLLPEVMEAMLPFLREHFGNPSSAHAFGQPARRAVSAAREQVAALLDCDPSEVIFTSGGTEANNLAIRGVTDSASKSRHLITSAIEHPAILQPCHALEQQGWHVSMVGVDREGRVLVDDIRARLQRDPALVTVMHSNNETGVLQPIAEIAAAARNVGAVVHTDAAQSVGKIPISVRGLGVDLLTIAGHKLYAPKGVGALFVRRGIQLVPFVRGADHERGLRPGTENVAAIVGLGAACVRAQADLVVTADRLQMLRNELLGLLRAGIPTLALNGHATLRLPNTLNVRLPGISGSALLAATPEIAASTGSACHDNRELASQVILAMGVPPEEAVGSVRLSLGRSTTQDDVHRAAGALVRAWNKCGCSGASASP
jgi:cysteine desulfurase